MTEFTRIEFLICPDKNFGMWVPANEESIQESYIIRFIGEKISEPYTVIRIKPLLARPTTYATLLEIMFRAQ